VTPPPAAERRSARAMDTLQRSARPWATLAASGAMEHAGVI